MAKFARLLAGAALATITASSSAWAQDFNSATFSGTTIWVGGGVQFLSLPDINFTAKNTDKGIRRTTNSEGDWLDFGGAAGGGIETAFGVWGNHRVTGALKGFWSEVETDERTNCSGGPTFCRLFDPAGELPSTASSYLATFTDREATYWGGQAELKFGRLEPVNVRPDLYRNDYFIVGFDIRGIDQDNKLHGQTSGNAPVFTYKETLDTTYTGGYIGIGGEYSFGFIPGLKGEGGLYDRLGLRTFISARAGLYNAETDYDGGFAYLFTPGSSKISKSNDELAFIGTVSLETRKQIGPRTSLSLWTDYEYISSVPKLEYAGAPGTTTRIDDEALFASRTMLRLNIGLGPSSLYPPPPP
jgi:hypothetical protein